MPAEKEPAAEVSLERAMSQENLKAVIASNLTDLRKKAAMTQQELAERLNYTDKAISKWERGESLPDVLVLKRIADMFGVTVDYLLAAEHEAPLPAKVESSAEDMKRRQSLRARGFVTGMSILLVWMAAVVLFIIFDSVSLNPISFWFVFVCAICATLILWLVMNSIWFNRRRNYLIISLLMWSFLILMFTTVWFLADRLLWLMFILGIPGQASIIMWSRLKQSGND